MPNKNKNIKKILCILALALCMIPVLCGCSNKEIRTKNIEEICGISLDDVQTVFEDDDLIAKEDISEYFDKQFLEYAEPNSWDIKKVFYVYDKDNNLILQIEEIENDFGHGPDIICLTDSIYRGYYREITGTPSDENIKTARKAISEAETEKLMRDLSLLLDKINRLYGSVPVSVFNIAAALFLIIIRWPLLKKASEKGWKCLIPVYGNFVWYRTIGTLSSYILIIIALIIYFIAALSGNFPDFVSVMIIILLFIAKIIICRRTSKCFGHGKGYAFGLFFLPEVFHAILAFGKSKYLGPMEEY